MDKNQHIPQEVWEEIERFLRHEMTAEEEEIFKARMSNNPVLQQTTEEMRLLLIGVQEASLQGRLNEFHKELTSSAVPAKTSGKLLRIKWLAAASVIIIILISASLFLFNKSEEEKLFAQYYQPDAGLLSAMGTSANYTFDRAMVDYKTGNYKAAIKSWESLHTMQPNNDTLNYFLGSAWLANNKAAKAVPYLQQVAASPNSAFMSDANWYLALAYLKEKHTNEAIAALEKTTHPDKDALLKKLQHD